MTQEEREFSKKMLWLRSKILTQIPISIYFLHLHTFRFWEDVGHINSQLSVCIFFVYKCPRFQVNDLLGSLTSSKDSSNKLDAIVESHFFELWMRKMAKYGKIIFGKIYFVFVLVFFFIMKTLSKQIVSTINTDIEVKTNYLKCAVKKKQHWV